MRSQPLYTCGRNRELHIGRSYQKRLREECTGSTKQSPGRLLLPGKHMAMAMESIEEEESARTGLSLDGLSLRNASVPRRPTVPAA